MATILYAIVGMPLFLLYLSNIGNDNDNDNDIRVVLFWCNYLIIQVIYWQDASNGSTPSAVCVASVRVLQGEGRCAGGRATPMPTNGG